MRHRRRLISLVVAFLGLVLPFAPPARANTGTGCAKVGQVNKKFDTVCSRVGKKLVWVKVTGKSSSANCSSQVHFTKNFIEPAHVQVVTPIGGQTAFGGSIAVRSYVHPPSSLYGQLLPLFAPTAMTLYQASYYLPSGAPADYKPEYSLFFDAGCSISVQFYHVKGVVGKVASVVPTTASSSSAGQNVTKTKIAAGEQFGWYQGEAGRSVAFDFRVEDSANKNQFINQARFEASPLASGELFAKCPFDYFIEPLKSMWLGKLGSSSGVVVPGTPCGKPTQGVNGTANGMWFLPNAKVNSLTFDGVPFGDPVVGPAGQYMSQIALTTDADGTVRIGGLNVASPLAQMVIFAGHATWKKPEDVAVGQTHCWADTRQAVKVQLASASSLLVAIGSNGCDELSVSAGRRYER